MAETKEMLDRLQRGEEELCLEIKELREQLAALRAEVKDLRDELAKRPAESPAVQTQGSGSSNDHGPVLAEIVDRLKRPAASPAEAAVKPYRINGDTVYFGEYPQSVKADKVKVSATPDSRGYYLGSDGAYYAKAVAAPNTTTGAQFTDGEAVEKGRTYYFKVEPIAWRILKKENDTALLLCEKIIATRKFDPATNHYADSDVRKWLNGAFVDTAFSKEQQACIKISAVDNSAASTGQKNNPNHSPNTKDAVFLLSHTEARDPAYGFSPNTSSDSKRSKRLTDYCAATGTICYDGGTGYWWLRSPQDRDRQSQGVIAAGQFYAGSPVFCNYGVAPALRIKL